MNRPDSIAATKPPQLVGQIESPEKEERGHGPRVPGALPGHGEGGADGAVEADLAGGDFQRPLGRLDAFEMQRFEPPAAFTGRRPLRYIRRKLLPLMPQAVPGHFLIDSTPE